MRIHHIGYLVSDMNQALEEMIRFGGSQQGETVFDSDRMADIAFFENGGLVIELVCPREGSKEVGESLRRLGSIPYHLCFECNDLAETLEELKKSECILVKDPQAAVALGNRRVAFLYSEGLGLFEVMESGETNES